MERRTFATLDGLRGVAAVVVLLFHLHGTDLLLQHGHLAVDLFFLMSGVVIANAYEPRLQDGWSFRAFVWTRIVRLYPIYALGIVLSLVAALYAQSIRHETGLGDVAALTALGLLFAPVIHLDLAASLFPTNAAAWSLFFELAANLVYAAGGYRLQTRSLAIVVGAAGIALLGVTLAYGATDLGSQGREVWGGAARVGFSFPLGVLIYRLHCAGRFAGVAGTPASLAVTVAAMLLVQPFGGILFEDLVILVLFPGLVVVGLQAKVSPRQARWFALVGAISYPLYMIHEPVSLILGEFAGQIGIPNGLTKLGVIAMAITAAYAANRWFDVPLRRMLTRRLHATLTARGSALGLPQVPVER